MARRVPGKISGPGWIHQLHGPGQFHSDTIYAGTPYGVYKSIDCAEQWFKTSLSGIEINAIKVSQINPHILIASSDSIVYKSLDYGVTWNAIWQSEKVIGAIAIDPGNSLHIWAGINVPVFQEYTQNLYHSIDGGDSWESVSFPRHVNDLGVEGEEMKLEYVRSILFDPSNNSIIYAVGKNDSYHISNGGVFISKDKGETWTNTKMMSSKTSPDDVLATAATPAAYVPRTAFVLVNDGNIDKKLFKSHDFGDTWEEIGTPSTDYIDGSAPVMEIDPEFPEWLYFGANYKGESSILAYDAEEDSWHYFPGSPLKNPSSFLLHSDYWCLGFGEEGAYRWADADTSWIPKNIGMNEVQILDLVANPKDPDKVFAAIEGYLVRTKDGGENWMREKISFNSLAMSKKDTSILLAGTAPANFLNNMDPFYYYRSENGGISWNQRRLFSVNGPIGYSFKLWTGDILLYPSDPDKYIFGIDGGGGGTGTYITKDGGSSWLINFGTGVSTFAQDPNNEEIIYLGTTNSGYIHRSEEGGKNWELVSPSGDAAFVENIWDLEVDKNSQVFAATSSGLYKWESGTNWLQVQELTAINTKAIAIDNQPDLPVYYVGTEDEGIFTSQDGGLTWESFNNGLGTLNITRLKINDSYPRNLYAGTKDGGVWVSTIQENATFVPLVIEQDININVFPNPSDGTFYITGNADSELRGELKVINLLGRVVYTERHFDIGSGTAQVVSLNGIAPGNYILMFTNNKVTINKKLIISSAKY